MNCFVNIGINFTNSKEIPFYWVYNNNSYTLNLIDEENKTKSQIIIRLNEPSESEQKQLINTILDSSKTYNVITKQLSADKTKIITLKEKITIDNLSYKKKLETNSYIFQI